MDQLPAQFPKLMFENKVSTFPRFKKFIIDTDAGCDDAHALICASYLLKHQRPDAELLGITAVAGNASLYNVVRNVYITVRKAFFDVPPKIYAGCSKDTLRRFYRDNFFKEDGFGGGVQQQYLTEMGLQDKETSFFHERQHACDFIRDSINKYGDELCVICLGPMTNIFLLIQMYPEVIPKLGALFAMGGTYIGVGNAHNAIAEFNVAADVEAVAAVLTAPFKAKYLLPFDVVLAYTLDKQSGKEVFENHQNTTVSKLIYEMFRKVCLEGDYYLCDQLVVILALCPQLMEYVLIKNIAVVADGMARGQIIIDWLKKLKDDPSSIIHIVTAFDWDKIQKLSIEINQ